MAFWMNAVAGKFDLIKGFSQCSIKNADNDSMYRMYRAILSSLNRAPVYAWTDETSAAVNRASQTIPDESILYKNQLPGPCGYWDSGSDSIFWFDYEGAVRLCWSNQARMRTFSWLYGKSISESTLCAQKVDPCRVRYPVTAKLFLAGCVWMNQKILLAGEIEPNRN